MNNPIRTLARSPYWQNLYARSKDLKLNLFNNISDFSKTQLVLLQWSEIYHNLYIDIASGENYINEEILKSDILVDAYLVYKTNKQKSKGKNKKKQEKVSHQPSLVFRSKRK